MFLGQPQMQFSTQGFPPGMGGPLPASGGVMPGGTLPNGGYVGMQQQGPVPANQGQNPYSLLQGQQQGQWNMNQVAQRIPSIIPIAFISFH